MKKKQAAKESVPLPIPDGTTIIQQDRNRKSDNKINVVDIPDTVTKIDKNAFNNWHALEKVILSSQS